MLPVSRSRANRCSKLRHTFRVKHLEESLDIPSKEALEDEGSVGSCDDRTEGRAFLEHENGAISNLTASYASASEYYMMNVYGKEASAYYDLHQGLRFLKRGTERAVPVTCEKNDAIREELDEFADAARGRGKPEMNGEASTRSLAVLRAGIKSAREGRRVEVAEALADG